MTLTLALPQDRESSSCSKPDKHHPFLLIHTWNNGERVIEGKIAPKISRPLWQTKPCSNSCFCISYLSPLGQVTQLIPLTHLQNGRVSTLQDPVRSWPWPSFSARHTGSSCLTAGELTEVQRNDCFLVNVLFFCSLLLPKLVAKYSELQQQSNNFPLYLNEKWKCWLKTQHSKN